jgi:hypothetical protein
LSKKVERVAGKGVPSQKDGVPIEESVGLVARQEKAQVIVLDTY